VRGICDTNSQVMAAVRWRLNLRRGARTPRRNRFIRVGYLGPASSR
jgi:hypothetical protein